MATRILMLVGFLCGINLCASDKNELPARTYSTFSGFSSLQVPARAPASVERDPELAALAMPAMKSSFKKLFDEHPSQAKAHQLYTSCTQQEQQALDRAAGHHALQRKPRKETEDTGTAGAVSTLVDTLIDIANDRHAKNDKNAAGRRRNSCAAITTSLTTLACAAWGIYAQSTKSNC